MNSEPTKTCGHCKVKKPLKAFGIRRTIKSGFNSWCRECCSEANRKNYRKNSTKRKQSAKEGYAKNPDYSRGNQYKRKFWPHLTWDQAIAEYERMLKDQNGKCAICGTAAGPRTQWGKDRRLDVDHNHKTSKVRKLVCNSCNHALGLFKLDDGLDLLKAALAYGESFQ